MPRRFVVLVAAAALTRVAGAQPAPCKVTIALAPDDVRAEIEAWVRAEPRCVRELEVRVVRTDGGGLYLSARDRDGRVRERVVPDAQSAAVLVVSWMADDTLGPTPPAPLGHAAATAPVPDPATIRGPDDDDESEGGTAAPTTNGVAATARPWRARRFLALGALGSPEGIGFRGQVDLFGGKGWTFGIAGGWREDDDADRFTRQARLTLATTTRYAGIKLRAQLGFGVDVTNRHDRDDRMTTVRFDPRMDDRDGHRADPGPVAEAALLASFRLHGCWGITGGPVLQVPFEHGHPTLGFFLGVQL